MNLGDSLRENGGNVYMIGHPLYPQSSNHPGMTLVLVHLTGS